MSSLHLYMSINYRLKRAKAHILSVLPKQASHFLPFLRANSAQCFFALRVCRATTTRWIPNAEWKANKRQKNVDYIALQFGLTLITYSIAHLVMLSAKQVIKLHCKQIHNYTQHSYMIIYFRPSSTSTIATPMTFTPEFDLITTNRYNRNYINFCHISFSALKNAEWNDPNLMALSWGLVLFLHKIPQKDTATHTHVLLK